MKLKKIFTAVIVTLIFSLQLIADDRVVNVLCYHRFTARENTTKNMKKWGDIYATLPDKFESQLQFIKDSGYNIIPMKQFVDYINGNGDVPDKTVVITIDDGYEDTYTKAWPILKKLGIPATIYLYESFIPGGKNALTFAQVKEMTAGGGIEVGVHSNTHPILTKKEKNCVNGCYLKFLEKEIIESKEYFKEHLGTELETFAYPYGTYSDEVQYFIKKAGYRAAFSVVPSYNTRDTEKYSLKRK